MRIFSTTGAALAILAMTSPARALDVDSLLRQVFGSSDPSDLGGPIFVLIGILMFLFFWGALKIGKRRQRAMIEAYDAQMTDYSAKLRRGK